MQTGPTAVKMSAFGTRTSRYCQLVTTSAAYHPPPPPSSPPGLRRPADAAHRVESERHAGTARDFLDPVGDRLVAGADDRVAARLLQFLRLLAAAHDVDRPEAIMLAQPQHHPPQGAAGRGLQEPG